MRIPFMRIPFQAALVLAAGLALPDVAQAANLYQRTFIPKHGGAACYARTYTHAEIFNGKDLPYRVTIDLNPAGPADGVPNSSANFAARFSIQLSRKHWLYTATSYCKTKGNGFACSVEADGGQFRLTRVGSALRLTTSRIQIEGAKADLDLAAKDGKPRYFTLKRAPKTVCSDIFN